MAEPNTAVAQDEMVTMKVADLQTLIDEKINARVSDMKAEILAADLPARPALGDGEKREADDKRPRYTCAASVKPWQDHYKRETVEFVEALLKGPTALTAWKVERSQDIAQGRAVLVGTADGATGGDDILPEEFVAKVVEDRQKLIQLVPRCTVFTTKERNGKIPTMTDPTVAWAGENVALTESTPTFSKNEYTAHKVAVYSQMAQEMVMDSGIDVVKVITSAFAKVFAEERDKMVAMGTDSSQPYGLYYASGVTEYAAGGALSYDVLVETVYKLARRYRKNAALICNDTNAKRIRLLKDSQDRPLFDPNRDGVQPGEPTKILGYPLLIQDDIPNGYLFFGDLKEYWIFDRESMGVEANTSATTPFTNHLLWLKAWERYDGSLQQSSAFIRTTGLTG